MEPGVGGPCAPEISSSRGGVSPSVKGKNHTGLGGPEMLSALPSTTLLSIRTVERAASLHYQGHILVRLSETSWSEWASGRAGSRTSSCNSLSHGLPALSSSVMLCTQVRSPTCWETLPQYLPGYVSIIYSDFWKTVFQSAWVMT